MAADVENSAFSESSAAERAHSREPRQPSRLYFWFGLLVVLGGLLVWRALRPVEGDADGRGTRHSAVGTQFTDVALEPLTGGGKPVTAAELSGKVTLINFWATWCGPCKLEFPGLLELEEHFRSRQEFQFFSVSTGNEGENLKQATTKFLADRKTTLATYQDPLDQTQQRLQLVAKIEGFGLPTTVLIGKSGEIRGLWVGYILGDDSRQRDAIEAALRGDALPQAAK